MFFFFLLKKNPSDVFYAPIAWQRTGDIMWNQQKRNMFEHVHEIISIFKRIYIHAKE